MNKKIAGGVIATVAVAGLACFVSYRTGFQTGAAVTSQNTVAALCSQPPAGTIQGTSSPLGVTCYGKNLGVVTASFAQ